MAERATVFQTVQIGVEATAGTGVAANKKLTATSISPAIKLEANKFRALGNKFATIMAPGKEWVSAKIEGAPSYNELAYLLSSLVSYAAPVQQGGSIAYLWTFNPATAALDVVKTLTVEQGSSVRAHKFAYGQINGLEINFSRAGIELSGEMLGNALQDGITMTGTPTEIALKPILPTQVNVYLADTYVGLPGTALTRVISAGWSFKDKYGPLFALASAGGTGFSAVVEKEPTLTGKLKVQADAAGMGLVTQMRAGSTKFMRIEAVGELIASTYYYTLRIDLAGKVSEPSEFSDEDGVYAIEWNLEGVHDATWGFATQLLLTNILTAL